MKLYLITRLTHDKKELNGVFIDRKKAQQIIDNLHKEYKVLSIPVYKIEEIETDIFNSYSIF